MSYIYIYIYDISHLSVKTTTAGQKGVYEEKLKFIVHSVLGFVG